ncbi:fatty acid/phospholipid synthesis protein PlsX-like protein [Leptospira kirschneri str. 2008720114]|nr:fatty acid/phospholipid synthesis protein PlsX-like protein [Leptospira kirschneri str. 2008720114]
MWVAVDVMSGDYGPEKIIEGAVNAVNQDGANVVLVGKERRNRGNTPQIRIRYK